MFMVAATFLLLSGIASLTYQVTWVRLLGLSMGSTSASISTVLAAFFLGMALGSYLAERITRNRINDFRAYIVLETMIGISGLMLLPALLHLDNLMAMAPAMGTSLGLKFLLAMTLLSIPTICMGATFPVMASIMVRRQQDLGLRISQLYSLNTAGAVLGAALSGFAFIPYWGLDGAIYIAFAINVGIAILATWANFHYKLPPHEAAPGALRSPSSGTDSPMSAERVRALIVLFATGFTAIATQVGWTKYLAIFTGTTIYGFAAILTVFLFGISAGSWAVRSRLQHLRSANAWMAFGLLLLGLSLLLTRAGLTAVPSLYGALNHLNGPDIAVHVARYVIVFVLLLIPTFILGALFPLNLKLYCGDLSGVRGRIGKAYAVNTLASIFGAILAGFWIIPTFGTDALLSTMAAFVLALPALFLPALKTTAWRTAAIVAIAGALGLNLSLPHLSYKDLIASVDYIYDNDATSGAEPEFLFLREGKAGVISVVTYDGEIAKVQNNGLNESLVHLKDPDKALLAETLLGIVPYILHADPKTGFVVGFGGGVTTRALTLTDLESIKVVELEPAIVDAARAIAGGPVATLQDSRVQLEYNDARNTLLVEDTTYDIIAAQPSHPWLAHASNVFTRDFWQIVKSRLNEGGVFGQWVNLFNMDAQTLRSILRAFYEVFPHGMSFANLDTGDFLLFGAKQPLTFDYDRIQQVISQPKLAAVLDDYGIESPQGLLWYYGLSRNEALQAAGDAVPNTDTNILSEVRLSRMAGYPEGNDDPYTFLRSQFRYDLAPHLDGDVAGKLAQQAEFTLEQANYFLAARAIARLTEVDETRGRTLQHRMYCQQYDYDKAFDLYAAHEIWPDETHLQHAMALADVGRMAEAFAATEHIGDPTGQRLAQARLLYEQGEWAELAALSGSDPRLKQWRLVGAAHVNATLAGTDLSQLATADTPEIPQMLVLLEHYTRLHNEQKTEFWARRLTEAVDKKTERLSHLASRAMDGGNIPRAQLLVGKIQQLNPDFDSLQDLQRKLSSLEASAEGSPAQAGLPQPPDKAGMSTELNRGFGTA